MLLRGRRLHRYLVLAHSVLFSLALIGSYVHRATATHGYCTEHGKLIHPAESHAAHAEDEQDLAITSAIHLEGAHGCAILEFLAQPTGAHPCGCISQDTCPCQMGSIGQTASICSSIPLLLQSPKHSPPRI